MMFDNQYSFIDRPQDFFPNNPVHVAQKEYEFNELLKIYVDQKAMRVVEIGTEYGGTLYWFLQHATLGAKVVNIDLWAPHIYKDNPAPLWQTWVPNGIELVTILGSSHDLENLRKLTHELPSGIDFLFIDGDHTYEGVKQDWLMYAPLVVEGGIVAFHDLMTPSWSPRVGVPKLWAEIKRAGYVTRELWASPEGGQTWGGIGVVYL